MRHRLRRGRRVRDGRAVKLTIPTTRQPRRALCTRAACRASIIPIATGSRWCARTSSSQRRGTKAITAGQKVGEVRAQIGAGKVAFVDQHGSGTFGVFLDQWLAFGFPAHLQYDSAADLAVRTASVAATGPDAGIDMAAATLVISLGPTFSTGAMPASRYNSPSPMRAPSCRTRRFIYIGTPVADRTQRR
jgi:hypothetical protein